jgi:hypothetical protein
MKNKSYFEPDLKEWRVKTDMNIFLLLTLDRYASFEVLIAVLLQIEVSWHEMPCHCVIISHLCEGL